MIRLDQPDRCAFCGQLIEPDEPKSGRGEVAAHVACADAAMADDRFWDRIAAGMGDTEPAEATSPGTGDSAASGAVPKGGAGGTRAARGGLGCGVLALVGLLTLASLFTARRPVSSRPRTR